MRCFEVGGRAIALRITDDAHWPQVMALLPADTSELPLDYIDVMISVIVRHSENPLVRPFHFVYRNWARLVRTHSLDDVFAAVRQVVYEENPVSR